MAKERQIACIYYKCEGECLKGREGKFWKTCQTCKKYTPRKGGVPAHPDTRREKKRKIKDRDMRQQVKDYYDN